LQYICNDIGGKAYVAADGGIYRVSVINQTLRGALFLEVLTFARNALQADID